MKIQNIGTRYVGISVRDVSYAFPPASVVVFDDHNIDLVLDIKRQVSLYPELIVVQESSTDVGSNRRSGSIAIPQGVSLIEVVLSEAFPDLDYSPNPSVANYIDVDPQILSFMPVEKLVDRFSIRLSANTDSPNYVLEYNAGTNN